MEHMTAIGSSVTRSLRNFAGFLVGFAVVFAVAWSALAPNDDMSVGTIRPLETHADPAQVLIEAHDCWTQAAPADVKVPGHVVVTRDGHAVYGGRRLVAQSLEQVFEGVDHGIDAVNAFCR